jgi:hypothetical protein
MDTMDKFNALLADLEAANVRDDMDAVDRITAELFAINDDLAAAGHAKIPVPIYNWS